MDDREDEIIKTTFEQWIKYTFEVRPNEAFSDPNAEMVLYDWDVNKHIEVGYISRLFASPVEATKNYTDAQIREALRIIIHESEGDLYELFNEEIPLELRVQVVKDMYIVFEKLFAPRCSPNLTAFKDTSHLNPLNSICFMWWDIIPLYGKSGENNREVLDSYCVDVMECTLHLGSIACQEGALHGLGHWRRAYPERIQKIIDDFLKRTPDIDSDLYEYALAARRGMVL